jgi:hypothetical protein
LEDALTVFDSKRFEVDVSQADAKASLLGINDKQALVCDLVDRTRAERAVDYAVTRPDLTFGHDGGGLASSRGFRRRGRSHLGPRGLVVTLVQGGLLYHARYAPGQRGGEMRQILTFLLVNCPKSAGEVLSSDRLRSGNSPKALLARELL